MIAANIQLLTPFCRAFLLSGLFQAYLLPIASIEKPSHTGNIDSIRLPYLPVDSAQDWNGLLQASSLQPSASPTAAQLHAHSQSLSLSKNKNKSTHTANLTPSEDFTPCPAVYVHQDIVLIRLAESEA